MRMNMYLIFLKKSVDRICLTNGLLILIFLQMCAHLKLLIIKVPKCFVFGV